jgi:hypothetical protein
MSTMPSVVSQPTATVLPEVYEYASKHGIEEPLHRAADTVRLLEETAELFTVVNQITLAMCDYEREVLRDVTWRAP